MNEKCVANQKKTPYKEEDEYCSKCGHKLYYVCKKCYTQLPDDSGNFCVRCYAEKEDQKDRIIKTTGGVLTAVGFVVVNRGKKGINTLSKIK